MRLDYGTQLSPVPITLSIGTLRKPTLKEISQITFDRFSFYEFFLKLSPETYYTKLRKENDGEAFWDSLTEEEKDKSLSTTLLKKMKKSEVHMSKFLTSFLLRPSVIKRAFLYC